MCSTHVPFHSVSHVPRCLPCPRTAHEGQRVPGELSQHPSKRPLHSGPNELGFAISPYGARLPPRGSCLVSDFPGGINSCGFPLLSRRGEPLHDPIASDEVLERRICGWFSEATSVCTARALERITSPIHVRGVQAQARLQRLGSAGFYSLSTASHRLSSLCRT